MAKFTVEKWRCDRCGIVADKWAKPGSAYEVRAFVDYGTAGGEVIGWREMCSPCNRAVEEEIEAMKTSAAKAKSEQEAR